jgi:hypothetical protein
LLRATAVEEPHHGYGLGIQASWPALERRITGVENLRQGPSCNPIRDEYSTRLAAFVITSVA